MPVFRPEAQNSMKPNLQPPSSQGEFALFIDESGSPKPNPKDSAPYFALGGFLIERKDESTVQTSIEEFKHRWDIPLTTALHGNEIRSKKKNFAWLGKLEQEKQNQFHDDLTNTIIALPIIIHACVVSRQGYLSRYHGRYGSETWEMMKSAFSILVERAAKYAGQSNGTIMIYYEEAGKHEDRLTKRYFEELRTGGHPFDPTNASQYAPLAGDQLSACLRGIEGKTKRNPLIQVADLCLYPIARAKDRPNDRAYQSLADHGLLVDSKLEEQEISTLGIKYYCFDHLV